jgi:hypothetical protein
MSETTFAGGCHCRAIGFVYRTARAPQDWSVRACSCAFCRAHGVVSTSDPAGLVELSAREGTLQRYRFGHRSADFLICRNCGVYVAAVMGHAGGRYAVINVRALEAPPPGLPPPTAHNLEGEQPAERNARRLQRWTPVVGDLL